MSELYREEYNLKRSTMSRMRKVVQAATEREVGGEDMGRTIDEALRRNKSLMERLSRL